MSAGISGESRSLWANRGAMDWVILVDEDTCEKQLKDSSKTIWILRESLNLVRKKMNLVANYCSYFCFLTRFLLDKMK